MPRKRKARWYTFDMTRQVVLAYFREDAYHVAIFTDGRDLHMSINGERFGVHRLAAAAVMRSNPEGLTREGRDWLTLHDE
jgi:hypothetical protein